MRQIFWILIASLLICTVSEAKVVKGIVTCGENKLSGVVVTDGKKFTRTRKDGSFRLNVGGDAKHVYIVTPSGVTMNPITDNCSGVFLNLAPNWLQN